MSSDQNSIDNIINQAKAGKDNKADNVNSTVREKKLSPNKIIDRLDDVTLQSEVEASKVVDLINETTTRLGEIDQFVKELRELIKSGTASEDEKLVLINKIASASKEVQDELFNAMNLLQYQDVLRQKIEKIASALSVFYDYLGEFLGKGKLKVGERAAGKHVEEASLSRDQKLDEIEKIIEDSKKE